MKINEDNNLLLQFYLKIKKFNSNKDLLKLVNIILEETEKENILCRCYLRLKEQIDHPERKGSLS